MSTIEMAGALRPGTTNTPLDQRSRVATLAEITSIVLPYLGMIVYCVETDRYYKVTSLKSTQIGALTVADAAVDSYEELPITTAELELLILDQVTNSSGIRSFLETLILGMIKASQELTDPSVPYTFPNVTVSYITAIIPSEEFFADVFEGDWNGVENYRPYVYQNGSVIDTSFTGEVNGQGGTELTTQDAYLHHFSFASSGGRVKIDLPEGTTGELTIYWNTTPGETVNFTGVHVPKYFKRPEGDGAWQLKIGTTVVPAQYWTGTAWKEFPEEGLTGDYAGSYIRAVDEPEFPSFARWYNTTTGVDGIQFLYLT